MSLYRIDFKNSANKIGTINPDAGFNYTDKLNKTNEANVNISSMSTVDRTLIAVGSEVYIYRDDVLEFHGVVDDRSVFTGGGISLHAMGYEKWLTIEHGAYAGSPYVGTASATILAAVIAESAKWTAGTLTAGSSMDYRMTATDSLWNVISDIRTKTQQDITLNYATSVIGIIAHKGSSTSVRTFNAEIDIHNIRFNNAYPKGNKVVVWGKGDGDNQIKSEYPSHGYNLDSQNTYGVIYWPERDPKVMSVSEANTLADALVAIYKQPIKVYDFDLSDFSVDIESGDVIILNSPSQDLNAEQVRITSITRGMNSGREFWTLEVANEEYSRSLKTQMELEAALDKKFQEQQTYMQGTTNILTFSDMINANSTLPLRVVGNLNSSDIYDEAGNRRVNSFKLDYDVDPYRRGVGTATETNVAPDVTGSSDNTQPGVSGSSDNTQPGVSGTSDTTTPTSTGGVSVWAAFTVDYVLTSSQALAYAWSTVVGGPTYYTTRTNIMLMNATGGSVNVTPKSIMPSGTTTTHATNYGLANNTISAWTTGESASGSLTGFFKFWDNNYACSSCTGTGEIIYSHTHGTHSHTDGSYTADNHLHADGSYAADNHLHADGSFAAGSHNHSVSVGDGVSDSGSVNATQVSIYVDFWNTGTSAWVNKHSILNTGKTLDTDVDISNGNTLPDAAGFWRVRVITNNATPDLVQAIMKIKHQLDT